MRKLIFMTMYSPNVTYLAAKARNDNTRKEQFKEKSYIQISTILHRNKTMKQAISLVTFISIIYTANGKIGLASISRQTHKDDATRDLQNTNGLLNLPTTFSGSEINYGNMFEIVSLTDIVIKAFDVHTVSEDEEIVEIYNRKSALGALRSPGAWTQISVNDLTVQGQGEISKLFITFPLPNFPDQMIWLTQSHLYCTFGL